MSNEHSPYREEDAEARARLDAEQREELAEQARLRKLSRNALKNENVNNENAPPRRFRMVPAISKGSVVGAILGGVGWWVTDDWFFIVAAAITGIIGSVVVFGLWNKPEGKFSDVPENTGGAGGGLHGL